MIAFSRLQRAIAALVLCGHMLKVTGSTSTKIGVAPSRWTLPAVAKKV